MTTTPSFFSSSATLSYETAVTEARAARDAAETHATTSATEATTSATEASNAAAQAADALTSKTDAETYASDATEQATLAQSYKDLARRYASDPVGTEIESGVESAKASATRAQAMIAAIAGIPVKYTGSGATYTPTSANLLGAIWRNSDSCTKIKLPQALNTSLAASGDPSLTGFLVINGGTNSLTLEPEAVSVADSVRRTGYWAAGPIRQDTQPASSTTTAPTISVPAGTGRWLFVTITEMNNSTTSHTVGLTTDVGTVTQVLAATGSTGKYSTSPYLNMRSWKVALADDAASATSVTLTFAIPTECQSMSYTITAVDFCLGITGGGASYTSASTGRSELLAVPNNGAIAVTVSQRNGTATVSMTGPETVSSSVNTGSRTQKDHVSINGYHDLVTGADVTTITTWSNSDQGGWAYAIFSPTAGSASGATLLGVTSIPTGKTAEVLALSDGIAWIAGLWT
jgi:hypothetical protein